MSNHYKWIEMTPDEQRGFEAIRTWDHPHEDLSEFVEMCKTEMLYAHGGTCAIDDSTITIEHIDDDTLVVRGIVWPIKETV